MTKGLSHQSTRARARGHKEQATSNVQKSSFNLHKIELPYMSPKGLTLYYHLLLLLIHQQLQHAHDMHIKLSYYKKLKFVLGVRDIQFICLQLQASSSSKLCSRKHYGGFLNVIFFSGVVRP